MSIGPNENWSKWLQPKKLDRKEARAQKIGSQKGQGPKIKCTIKIVRPKFKMDRKMPKAIDQNWQENNHKWAELMGSAHVENRIGPG